MKAAGKLLLTILGLIAISLIYILNDFQTSQAKTDPILNLLTTIEVGGIPDAIVVDTYGDRNDILFYDLAIGKVRFIDGNTFTLASEEVSLPSWAFNGWMEYDHYNHHAYVLNIENAGTYPDNWQEVKVNVVAARSLVNSFSVNDAYNLGQVDPPDQYYGLEGFVLKQPHSEGENPARLLIDNTRNGNVDVIDLDHLGTIALHKQRFSYRDPVTTTGWWDNNGNSLALETQHETVGEGDLGGRDVVYIADKNRPYDPAVDPGYGFIRPVQISHYPATLNATLLPEVNLNDSWSFSNGFEGIELAGARDRLYVASAIQSFDDGYVGVVNTSNDQVERVITTTYADPGFVHVDWYDPRRVFVTTFDGFYNDPDQGLYLNLVYDDVVVNRIQLMPEYDEYNGVRGMVFDPYTNRLYLSVGDTIMVVEVNYGAPPATPPSISASANITAAGGSLTTPDEVVQLDFPAGAVSLPTTVTYTETAYAPASDLFGVHFFNLTAVISGTTTQVTSFNQPYTVTVNYSPSEAGPAIDATLGLYWWDGSQWMREPTSSVDVSNQQVVATLEHMTLFAVLGETRRVLLPMIIH